MERKLLRSAFAWLLPAFVFCIYIPLPVAAQPRILTQPLSQLEVPLGTNIVFRVVATTTNGPLRYQWRLNGVNLTNTGAYSDTFSVTNVTATQSGSYMAVVADNGGVTNTVAVGLTVHLASSVILTNDNFDDAAILLPVTNGVVRSSNTNATLESSEPKPSGKNGGKSVWFSWTAPDDGIATFTTSGSDFDTLMDVYTPKGGKVDLKHLDSVDVDLDDDDYGGFLTSKLVFNATNGSTYYITVDGFGGASGNIVLNWDFDATIDENVPAISSKPVSKTVSYGTNLNFSITYSGKGVKKSVWYFNGADTGNTNDNFGEVLINELTVGTYSVQLETQHGHKVDIVPAEIQVSILAGGASDPNARALDKFLDATISTNVQRLADLIPPDPPAGGPVLEGIPNLEAGTSRGYTSTQIFSTSSATTDPGEPHPCGVIGGASQWYSYQAAANGMLHINTDGSTFDTVLAVYIGDGSSYSTLTNITCDNSVSPGNGGDRVRFPATANTIYYIQVDGVNGARGTVRLNINLGDPPLVGQHPTNQTVRVGTNVTLAVTAGAGSTNFYYSWLRNGAAIPNATNATYTITNAQFSQSGNYVAVISNLVDTVLSSNAVISILNPPAITQPPPNQTVNIGSTVNLSVGTTGDALSYVWRDGVGTLLGTNATLILTNVQPSQAGNYRVVVTNAIGAVTNQVPAVLVVNYPPNINLHPFSRTVALSNNVTLTAGAVSVPPPLFQWKLNGLNLPAATNATLTVTNFHPGNEGNYVLVATNPLGAQSSHPASILLNFPMRMGSFGQSNGVFNLQLIGIATTNYIIQVSTNLTVWIPLVTNNDVNGVLSFTDTNTSGPGLRFYRAKPAP